MEIYDFDQLYASGELHTTPAVISIGVFDGLHLGHQRIIQKAVSIAHGYGREKVVVFTFAQNPKTMMGYNSFDKPLMSLRQSTDFFAELGVDCLVVIDFSPDFSKLTGEEFIKRCCSMFAVRAVVVGENFRCGYRAATGCAELQQIVPRYADHARIEVVPLYRLPDGNEDSSTLVRMALVKGEIERVAELLGRFYTVDVSHLPFRCDLYPWRFSLDVFGQLLPPQGIYETRLRGIDGVKIDTMTEVEKEFLTLTFRVQTVQDGCKDNEEKTRRYDSLEFVKELTIVC